MEWIKNIQMPYLSMDLDGTNVQETLFIHIFFERNNPQKQPQGATLFYFPRENMKECLFCFLVFW
jgi:hypothetical protein